jgi:hypothetical protein
MVPPLHPHLDTPPNPTHPHPNTQVKVKVNSLHGHLPYAQQCKEQLGHFHPTAAFVVASLSAGGEVLGLETQTTYTDTLQEGCMWAEWLTFCVKVRPSGWW